MVVDDDNDDDDDDDDGTQFTAKEFQDYCQKNGIQHIRSPPYQPHCNGQAERFVDTFKRTLDDDDDQEMKEVKSGRKQREFAEEDA